MPGALGLGARGLQKYFVLVVSVETCSSLKNSSQVDKV